jgi:hypothetical protein
MKPTHLVMSISGLAAVLAMAAPAAAGEATSPAPAPSGTAVINNDSYVRAFLAFRTPMIITKDGGLKVALDPGTMWGPPKTPTPLPDFQSPLPPDDWNKPDYDDTAWDRQRSPVEMAPEWWGGEAALHTATVNSVIFMRWKFAVEDPAAARDLKLSLEYVGGAVAYVNGKELTRVHLPSGELKPDTLAEKYPDDLYVLEGNKMLGQTWPGESIKKENVAAFERRYRRLDGFAVPPEMLRKGSNVLAVRIHRSPVNEAVIGAERFKEGGMSTRQGVWAYAGLKTVRLASASGAGVTPNTARPKGVQVWNVAAFHTISAFDYGDAGDTVKPVTVAAVRNSVFSGRLAVSSDAPIRGLKVTVGELKDAKGGGTLPASAVKVRYAEPAVAAKCWNQPQRFDGLLEAIPAEIPVVKVSPGRETYLNQPVVRAGLASGAVASLWLTARVPKDAKGGRYEGTVTVEAEGLKSTAVPLVLTVNDWAMPDPKDFRQHHLIYMSTDSVAKHYKVPLWSDKHFDLMEKTLALMTEINAREVPATLAINFHSDNKGDISNEESLVRWIKDGDGYKYDFTVFDKYMDRVAKVMGKPLPLRVACWGEPKKEQGQMKMPGWPTHVSLLDPATGKLDKLAMPAPGTEESVAFWKPVLDEVRKKSEARGWWDVTALGHNSYCYSPLPETVSMAKKIWPDGVWSYIAHNGTLGAAFPAAEKGVSMPIKFSVCVWTEGGLSPRGCKALLKPRPSVWSDTARNRHWDWSPLILLRNLPEEVINRGMDGVGDFGADLFPVAKDGGRGFYMLGNGRGTGGPGAATHSLLAPGPDGAVATERYECFREGTEFSEAILYLEQALLDKKISGDLAAKVDRYLDARGEAFIKFWYSRGGGFISRWTPAGMADRDAELLALCGEVAKAVGGK